MEEACGRLGDEEEMRRGEGGGRKERMGERASGSRENDEAILEERKKGDGLVEELKGERSWGWSW